MEEDALAKMAPERLAALLTLDEGEASAGWLEADLAGILQHQLHAPLVVADFGADAPPAEALPDVAGDGPRCFAELLASAQPSLAMLQLFQRFAKLSLAAEPGPLPAAVAAVIYYMSITLAQLRLGQRISSLSDAQLAQGLRWVLAQPWITPDVRAVAHEGAATLAERSP